MSRRSDVRDEDRFDPFSVAEPQQKFDGPVNGSFLLDDSRRPYRERASELGSSSRLRSLIASKSTDAVSVDPLENLPGVKPRATERVECVLESGNVELGDVGAQVGVHESRVAEGGAFQRDEA